MSKPTAIGVVQRLLGGATDDTILAATVDPKATYTSLAYNHPALKKLMPYCGVAKNAGPAAVKFTFQTVGTIWVNEMFEILSIFSDEDSKERKEGDLVNVAVFGKFTYRSRVLGKRYTSPFSFWCKVNVKSSLVEEMQFMEDTVSVTDVQWVAVLLWCCSDALAKCLVLDLRQDWWLTSNLVRYRCSVRKVWL